MNQTPRALTLILVLCFFDSSSDAALLHSAMAQARKDPVIVLPKARYALEHPWYSTDPDPNAIDSKSVVVSIASESEIYVGNARVAKQELAVAIRNAMLDKRPKVERVFIKSGAAIQFSTVTEVLNATREAGYDRIEFVVERTEPSSAAAVLEGLIVKPSDITPFLADLFVVSLGSSLNSAGRLTVNTLPVPLSGLRRFLGGHLEQRPDKSVFIKPAPNRSYGDVIAAADAIVGAGAQPLGVLIDEMAVPRGIPKPNPHPPVITPLEGVPGGLPGGPPGEAGGPPPPPRAPADGPIARSERALRASATHRVEAITPPLAKKGKVSGTVVVEIVVAELGNVFAARVVSGHELLREAALSAARQWKFEPTTISDVPARVIGTLSFVFK